MVNYENPGEGGFGYYMDCGSVIELEMLFEAFPDNQGLLHAEWNYCPLSWTGLGISHVQQ